MTGAHSPAVAWRNNRTLGYQGEIGSIEHPAPVRNGRQHRPDGHIESAGHMHGRIVDRYHEIHRRRLRREIVKVLEGVDRFVVEDLDPEVAPNGLQIGSTVAILEIDETEGRLRQYRRPGRQRDRANSARLAPVPPRQEIPTSGRPPNRSR